MHQSSTADAACIVRVWVEPGDRVLRGRVESVPGDAAVVARGLEELVAAVRDQLEGLERLLTQQVGTPGRERPRDASATPARRGRGSGEDAPTTTHVDTHRCD